MSNPVLPAAYAVSKLAKDVSLNLAGIQSAAQSLYTSLKAKPYTAESWSLVPLHPDATVRTPQEIIDWVFLVSALNFSFWSDLPSDKRYGVQWKAGVDGKCVDEAEKVHTGYWSLIAALHRAKEEGVDITNPKVYKELSVESLRKVFRSDQAEEIPLFDERVRVLREVGEVLCSKYDGTFATLLKASNRSSLSLVNTVVTDFPCFNDTTSYPGIDSPLPIRKRAQILVAELWAAFGGEGWGRFLDIDELTMFADYRVPQILHSLQTIDYSPRLVDLLKTHVNLPNGSPEEVEIRALSIVAVEELRLAIARLAKEDPEGGVKVPNAVLLDFLLQLKHREGIVGSPGLVQLEFGERVSTAGDEGGESSAKFDVVGE
ncbi:hypothetical protein MNV49_002587 [Pseudohyphozyma bogoriensis]|nr:hypothetical protein MNV49_002587 [Pseudohyphozyma bogoriensis]